MAGLILAQKFTTSSSLKSFRGFIEYMDRPDAINLDDIEKYDIFGTYQDYMDDPEKTTGLFTDTKDALSATEKKELKSVFAASQKKGSVLFQSVISFEDTWLEQTGIKSDGKLNQTLLREYTRSAVKTIIAKEGLGGAVWSAAIHHNTNHTHIHIALIDPEPKWIEGQGRCRRDQSGKLYQRGKWKQGTIEATKSTFVNKALQLSDVNKEINHIIRDRIVINYRNKSNSPDIERALNNLLSHLPEDMRLWKYNMNAMQSYLPEIDHITDMLLNEYYDSDFNELKVILSDIDEKYSRAYGGESKFMENKINELYSRLGNVVLAECRNVKKNAQIQIQRKKSLPKVYNKYLVGKALSNLRRVFRKDIKNIKNQAIYEQLQQEQREKGEFSYN